VVFIVIVGGVAIGLHTGAAAVPRLSVALSVIALVLVLRHRAPLAVMAVLLIVALSINFPPVVVLPVLLGLFTVAKYSDRRWVIVAAALAALVFLVTPVLHGAPTKYPQDLGRIVPVGLAVAIGLYLRARADYVGGLQERAERLERERELLAEQAVADERVQIARELHDVVAHNVSLMVVQAQALAATGPPVDEQQAALGRVANLGREALSEMHRMLGVLRLQDGIEVERAPQPGVRDLETLVEHACEAGVETRLVVVGGARELSPGVDLSAFRIVQEALTNVIRHAHARRATVTLSYTPGKIDVTIEDDGVGAPPGPARNGGGPGHGLVGMRERVTLFGGDLRTGPGPDRGGYRVQASLPFS
jgi:signal transduction histidine kinase